MSAALCSQLIAITVQQYCDLFQSHRISIKQSFNQIIEQKVNQHLKLNLYYVLSSFGALNWVLNQQLLWIEPSTGCYILAAQLSFKNIKEKKKKKSLRVNSNQPIGYSLRRTNWYVILHPNSEPLATQRDGLVQPLNTFDSYFYFQEPLLPEARPSSPKSRSDMPLSAKARATQNHTHENAISRRIHIRYSAAGQKKIR